MTQLITRFQRMSTPSSETPCPCHSGADLGHCCGPYLAGERPAPTAEALMRSRFSAFQLRDSSYVARTWAPSKRPGDLSFEGDARTWSRLEIASKLRGEPGDDRGVVEFKAWFDLGEDTYLLHETSRFEHTAEGWLYLDGTVHFCGKVAHRGEILRNAPCPCGSGKKYKKCCG